MTNAEKFKTVDERIKHFNIFCSSRICNICELTPRGTSGIRCALEWLELEYEKEPKPCPFCGHTEIDIVLSGCHGGFDACCKNCGATVIAESRTMVIEKWNRRAT